MPLPQPYSRHRGLRRLEGQVEDRCGTTLPTSPAAPSDPSQCEHSSADALSRSVPSISMSSGDWRQPTPLPRLLSGRSPVARESRTPKRRRQVNPGRSWLARVCGEILDHRDRTIPDTGSYASNGRRAAACRTGATGRLGRARCALARIRLCRATYRGCRDKSPRGGGFDRTAGTSAAWMPDGTQLVRAGADPDDLVRFSID